MNFLFCWFIIIFNIIIKIKIAQMLELSVDFIINFVIFIISFCYLLVVFLCYNYFILLFVCIILWLNVACCECCMIALHDCIVWLWCNYIVWLCDYVVCCCVLCLFVLYCIVYLLSIIKCVVCCIFSEKLLFHQKTWCLGKNLKFCFKAK